jgi:hypothetical protein
VLTGFGGADTLEGKGGNDSYAYWATADSTGSARDSIVGFDAGDRIDLARIDANLSASANNAFTFVGGNAFSGTAGELRTIDHGGNSWTIEADTNGDMIADLVIGLTTSDPAYVIGAGDFVL